MFLFNKFFKFLSHLYRKNSSLLNFISVRAFSYSSKSIRVKYQSKLFKLNFFEFINIYKLEDVIINKNYNCIQKNNVVYKKNRIPIISESIKEDFYFKALNKLKLKNLFNKNVDKTINTKKDIYYFEILNNKPNYYHFIVDNFLSLIFFLEKYKKDFIILFNDSIAKHINSYVYLVSKIYKKKIIVLNKNSNQVRVVNNLIFLNPIMYQKVRRVHGENINKISKSMIDEKYNIYNYPKKYKNSEGKTVYNQFIGNITPTTFFENFDNFIKKITSAGVIKKKLKKNLYITRKKGGQFKNRSIFEEEKLIEFLKQRNFKVVSFEGLSVEKQIELMINSNIVISVFGSNLTNAIFKRKGESVIELYPHQTFKNADFFKYIAEQRNLKYFRINCDLNKNEELLIKYKQLNKILNSLRSI